MLNDQSFIIMEQTLTETPKANTKRINSHDLAADPGHWTQDRHTELKTINMS